MLHHLFLILFVFICSWINFSSSLANDHDLALFLDDFQNNLSLFSLNNSQLEWNYAVNSSEISEYAVVRFGYYLIKCFES